MQISKPVILFFNEKIQAPLVGMLFFLARLHKGAGAYRLFTGLLGAHFLYLINSSVMKQSSDNSQCKETFSPYICKKKNKMRLLEPCSTPAKSEM